MLKDALLDMRIGTPKTKEGSKRLRNHCVMKVGNNTETDVWPDLGPISDAVVKATLLSTALRTGQKNLVELPRGSGGTERTMQILS
ncbi:hypothetical protein SDJN03_24983, partial [Cucurbita argyrosperma subsp. sororia]